MEVETDQTLPHPYQQPIDLPFTLPTRIYSGMLVIWLLRPALQRRFPLHHGKRRDYMGFLAWCCSIGRRQSQLLREIDSWNQELMRPVSLPNISGCRWQHSYSIGMYLVGISRARYWSGQLLTNVRMRHRAARWYFRDGRELLGLPDCPDWQLSALQQGFGDAQQFEQMLLMPKDRQAGTEQRILTGVADIIQAWEKPVEKASVPPQPPLPVSSVSRWLGHFLPPESNELVWLAHEARQKLPWVRSPSVAELQTVMQDIPVSRAPSSIASTGNLPWGVNLIGYARGELGIGEDVRMMARSLEAAGVPFCIINVEPGAEVSQGDTTAEHWIEEKPRYAISLFCMTGIEMARMSVENGLEWLKGHYNIGLWPWELPAWPVPWHHAWSLVDELWGISRYTADAYSRAPIPVLHMPMAVQVKQIADLGRKDWGLPEDDYLFVFSFDRNSTLSRKNPMAAVEAFLQAFRASPDEKVGLVIKVSHLDPTHPSWKEMARMIKQDPRIHLLSGEYRKDEILSLYQCCNGFISLHRSEGFGRAIAEAQMLGLDLITTSYSGNMDFCVNNDSRLVNYRMIDVKEGEYFFGSGQQWADADIAHAAEEMQACVAKRFDTDQSGYSLERFSPSVCGDTYRKRLEEIYQNINQEREPSAVANK